MAEVNINQGRSTAFDSPRAECTLKITEPFQLILADAFTFEDALVLLMESAAKDNQVPRFHYADGTPVFHLTIAPPNALASSQKALLIMETRHASNQ